MTAEELYNALPYTGRDKIQVVIATENDKYGMGRQIQAVLEDKANNAIIIVAEELKKPNITRGATGDE